jgi:hypothetical protein
MFGENQTPRAIPPAQWSPERDQWSRLYMMRLIHVRRPQAAGLNITEP